MGSAKVHLRGSQRHSLGTSPQHTTVPQSHHMPLTPQPPHTPLHPPLPQPTISPQPIHPHCLPNPIPQSHPIHSETDLAPTPPLREYPLFTSTQPSPKPSPPIPLWKVSWLCVRGPLSPPQPPCSPLRRPHFHSNKARPLLVIAGEPSFFHNVSGAALHCLQKASQESPQNLLRQPRGASQENPKKLNVHR